VGVFACSRFIARGSDVVVFPKNKPMEIALPTRVENPR